MASRMSSSSKLDRLERETALLFASAHKSAPVPLAQGRAGEGADVKGLAIDAAWNGFASNMTNACKCAMELFARDRRRQDPATMAFLQRWAERSHPMPHPPYSTAPAAPAAAPAARSCSSHQRFQSHSSSSKVCCQLFKKQCS